MSDNPICSVCGNEMDDYGENFWFCGECGNRAYIIYGDTSNEIHQTVDDISEDFGEDNMPYICESCDENEYYPGCIASCRAFKESDYYIDD